MKTEKVLIHNIPMILWGKESEHVYVYVHGKMSCKESAEEFARIAEKKGYQTLSFDLPEHGERKNEEYRCDIWNGKNDLTIVADYAFTNWSRVSLFACSLGAYFSLQTYVERKFEKCLFQSPMIDMEHMIRQMFLWFGVEEERLHVEKEIETPFDVLRWDYFQYVLAHPVKEWSIPTSILYGGKDNLQTYEIIKNFAEMNQCDLTVSEQSEHSFMGQEDLEIMKK